MAESRNVAFVGLGVMGYPMAGHLAAAGHQVTVYNRTEQKAEDWLKKHIAEARVPHQPKRRLKLRLSSCA